MFNTKGLKLIGKGLFSRVWDIGNGEVLIKSCCCVKECFAMGWMPEGENWPKIERVDVQADGLSVYKMKKYDKVKSLKSSLDADQYALYKSLSLLCKSLQASDRYLCKEGFNVYYLHDEFEKSPLSKVLKEQFIEAINAISNYTTLIGFEISPRNVAVDDGKLVLLDVFFDMEAVRQQKSYTYPQGK